jgi:hypothetical protein
LNRLLTLHWLLEDAHVSRAAQHLGTTQPAVSRSLRDLRAWFWAWYSFNQADGGQYKGSSTTCGR